MASQDQERQSLTTKSRHSLQLVAASLQRWLLLDGSRHVVAAGIVVVGFLLFVLLGYSGILDGSTVPMLYLFSALAGGNITLITIVITINQLILSRELRSPRELQIELESAKEYQQAVEEETERRGVPEQPGEFLHVLVDDTQNLLAKLESTVSETADSELVDELQELTTALGTELDETFQLLQMNDKTLFSALSTILNADFGARLNHARWVRRSYDGELSAAQQAILSDLQQHIEQLDIARQYFKTLYITQEFADVSKLVMYTGLIATMTALVFIVFSGDIRPSYARLARLVLLPLAVAINLVPLSLLLSHVVRITTIARRTAAITPFISPSE